MSKLSVFLKVDSIWRNRTIVANLEETIKHATCPSTKKNIEEIQEEDEDIYNSSKYNSQAKLEPKENSVHEKSQQNIIEEKSEKQKKEVESPKFIKNESYLRKKRKYLNFSKEIPNFKNEVMSKNVTINNQEGHFITNIHEKNKSNFGNVQNNISQTTKIIINNIGHSFIRKPNIKFKHQKIHEETEKSARDFSNKNAPNASSKRCSVDPRMNDYKSGEQQSRMTNHSAQNLHEDDDFDVILNGKFLTKTFHNTEKRQSENSYQGSFKEPRKNSDKTREKRFKKKFNLKEFLGSLKNKNILKDHEQSPRLGSYLNPKKIHERSMDFKSAIFSLNLKKNEPMLDEVPKFSVRSIKKKE